ncbi:MAG TPA: hypothetical protein VJB94_05790 [Candidatus Nanoarchaeia archaeon]|nr:hypothetical protein [Candidatus Nanoarchaeia archaeon]
MIWEDIIWFIVSCLFLVQGAKYSVKSIAKIAYALHINEFLISFVILGIVSSFPETFVGIASALKGDARIGIGTLLGSNMADLSLILGLIVLVGGNIKVSQKVMRYDFFFITLSIFPILLALDGQLSRLDGFILIASGLLFLYHLLKNRIHIPRKFDATRKDFMINSAIFMIAIAVLMISSTYVVKYASLLAIDFLVPPFLIGAILVALGTCLPELAFSIKSLKDGHSDLALGDLLGNVIVDATLMIGIVALISPVQLKFLLVFIIGIFMLITLFFVMSFIENGHVITKNKAIALVLIYIAYVISGLLIKGIA